MQYSVTDTRESRWKRTIAMMAFAGSLLAGGETFAQSPSTFTQDFRLWSPVFMTAKLPNSFLAHLEVQPRFADLDEDGHIDQLILRPAVGYQLTENLSVWQGYAWVGNFNQPHTPPRPAFFEESRIYQQILYSRKFDSFKITSRTRLEERWIEHVDGTAVRFRTGLRVMYSLPMAQEWALVASDEVFVHLNTVGSRGPQAGFDRNRFFAGINRTFSKYFNMDVGYQNELVNSRSIPNLANQMNHTILFQFFINI
jgi:Protein of unknown function (DUF2490)